MRKIIKLTEEQFRKLEEDNFTNIIDSSSEIPEYIQSQSTPEGKVNDEEFADIVTTDDLGDTMCKNFPWGYRGNMRYAAQIMAEGEDNSGDGVPDAFNHEDANELNDGNESDDQETIPFSVEKHLDSLINSIEVSNLTPKKKMCILNKLVDKMNLKGLPPSYATETSMKLKAKK
jgi:hypothetical protein